jgi:hypothetical protein
MPGYMFTKENTEHGEDEEECHFLDKKVVEYARNRFLKEVVEQTIHRFKIHHTVTIWWMQLSKVDVCCA